MTIYKADRFDGKHINSLVVHQSGTKFLSNVSHQCQIVFAIISYLNDDAYDTKYVQNYH